MSHVELATTITMGSLFDGIGGFPLAAARYGIKTIWASEIEPFPMAVTMRRFPSMAHKGDITKLSGKLLFPVDIICGGSPCQDLSVAGARAGLFGARSGLFLEQIRLVKEMRAEDERRGRAADHIRPRYLCWENVPGAFSSAGGEDFRIVLQEIIRIKDSTCTVPRPDAGRWKSAGAVLGSGFSLAWRCMDAQYWGVPQRRKRIFLVADFGGQSAFQILFRKEILLGHSAAGTGAREKTARCTGESFGDSGWTRLHQNEVSTPGSQLNPCCTAAGFSAGAGASAGSIGYSDQVAPTLKGSAGGNCMPSVLCLNDQGGGVMDCSEGVTGTLRAQEHGHQPLVMPMLLFENHGIDGRYTGPPPVAPTMSARYGTGGNNVPLVTRGGTICIMGPAIGRQPQNGGNGIGYQEDIAYTLTATDHHAVCSRQRVNKLAPSGAASAGNVCQHKNTPSAAEYPMLIRRLTPLECERLQGFPDGWTDIPGASDSVRYRALGNSVAIPCVEFIMRGIAAILRYDR